MVLGIITCVVFILGGALAASAFILAKKPDAKALMDKIAPYQGIIGVVMLGLGLWGLINALMNFGLLTANIVGMIQTLAMLGVAIGCGFLLGFGLVSQYVLGTNEEAKKKAESLRTSLLTYQIPLGFASIVLGVWGLVNVLRVAAA